MLRLRPHKKDAETNKKASRRLLSSVRWQL